MLEAVFKHLDLLERHFFGLQYVADSPDNLASEVSNIILLNVGIDRLDLPSLTQRCHESHHFMTFLTLSLVKGNWFLMLSQKVTFQKEFWSIFKIHFQVRQQTQSKIKFGGTHDILRLKSLHSQDERVLI